MTFAWGAVLSRSRIRRLSIGLAAGAVFLLVSMAEGAFWNEYAYSPRLLAGEGRLYLLYARNPLLGAEGRLSCLSAEEPTAWGRQAYLDLRVGPSTLVSGRFVIASGDSVAVYDERYLREPKEEYWLFSLALPKGLTPAALVADGDAVIVCGWRKADDGYALEWARFAPERDTKVTTSSVSTFDRPFGVQPLRISEGVVFLCADAEGRLRLLSRSGVPTDLGLKTESAFCAAVDRDGRRHLFTVEKADDGGSEVAEYVLDGTSPRPVGRYKPPFRTLLWRRPVIDMEAVSFGGGVAVICHFGAILAVLQDGRFIKVADAGWAVKALLGAFGVVLLFIATLLVIFAVLMRKAPLRPIVPSAEAEAARPWRRFAAFAVDMLILTGASLPFLTGVEPSWGRQVDLGHPALFALIRLAYFCPLEALLGATPGKYLFGIRVTDVEGGRAGPIQILVRNLFRLPDVVLLVEFAALAVTGRRIGDFCATTTVTLWRSSNETQSGVRG